MKQSCDFNLNKFFRKIKLKKQYVNQLTNGILRLADTKKQSYKSVSYGLFLNNPKLIKHKNLVTYIITISFSKSNASLHITDFSGTLKFSCSAGNLSFIGKQKKARTPVLKAILRVLNQKLKALQKKPVALHLKNVGFKKRWIVKRLWKKLLVKVVRCFNTHPHNGCRKRKARRKKFKKRSKKKKWLSGLKRQIVNLLRCLIAGSNPAFFI
jgi:ribosomal protein S11